MKAATDHTKTSGYDRLLVPRQGHRNKPVLCSSLLFCPPVLGHSLYINFLCRLTSYARKRPARFPEDPLGSNVSPHRWFPRCPSESLLHWHSWLWHQCCLSPWPWDPVHLRVLHWLPRRRTDLLWYILWFWLMGVLGWSRFYKPELRGKEAVTSGCAMPVCARCFQFPLYS